MITLATLPEASTPLRNLTPPAGPKGSLTLTFLLATTWSGMDLRRTDFKAGKPWGKVPRKGDAVVVMLMVAIAAVCPLLFPSDFYTATAVVWQFSHALRLPLLAGRRV
jgi:hypothetical protein